MSGSATSTPDVMFETAERLLGCCSAALADASDLGAPAAAFVSVGSQLAWDRCECGQLSVHVLRAYPSDTFPILKQTAPFDRCATKLTVVEYVVTILRCVPGSQDDGEPPVPADMTDAARQDFLDRWAVRRGVACCFETDNPLLPTFRLLGEQLAVGEGGRCAGSELHVFVGHPNCVPCTEP